MHNAKVVTSAASNPRNNLPLGWSIMPEYYGRWALRTRCESRRLLA
jgi:hypothetical protein